MTEQRHFRMPATGEAWRHYKVGPASLYTIVGLARDDKGDAVVVYTPYGWRLAQLPPLYTQPLGRFLQELDMGIDPYDSREKIRKQRFEFEREPGERCAYIAVPNEGFIPGDITWLAGKPEA
jgi:hypothetical protein